MTKHRDNLYTAMENMEMENEELREKIERLEEYNKHLKDMAERMRQEKDRVYNNNIRLVREIKELGVTKWK